MNREITGIKELDNLIYETVRHVQEINIDKINEEIKFIEIDERKIFNFTERLIYYNSKNIRVLMPCCCKKCGNFMHRPKISDITACKCKND